LGDVPRKLNLINSVSGSSILVPNSASGINQTIIYQESNSVFTVSYLSPVNTNGSFNDYSQLSSEKALLMIYHPAFQAASADYAAYRISPDGGQHNVILANVNELYQQYGGGVTKHINGIRRFAYHMHELASEKPEGLFLMGKGIREANVGGVTSTGPGSRTNVTNYANSFIPSFGQPSCDACITSDLPGTTKWTPLIPTGRIAASSNQELADYLDKVVLFEANQNQTSIYNTASKDWQKQILHFVGGTDANQQFTFRSYMNSMKDIIENQYFGGNVSTTAQNSGDPLNPSQLNAIMDRIQNGVSIISFFGHAAPTASGFEINIDEPSNWNNQGKYPLIISNSCYNGNIFQSGSSKSEDFVNIPNSGAIAYMGTVSLGFAHTLYLYSSEFYRQVSQLNYGGNLGSQIKGAISANESIGSDLLLESTCTQMALNGDPMIKLNWHEKPEIEITEDRVSFLPEQLDLTVDSIQMNIVLTNLGRSIVDTFSVEVTRNFPSATIDSVYTFYLPNLHYKDTLSFKMPLQQNIGLGINNFNVKVDLPTFIDEIYDENNNNQITKTLFIDVDGIIPLIPHEFAVVPEDSVTLTASTINPIAEFNTYRFEIDTTDLFNSPQKRFALVSGFGGLKSVNPSQWYLSSSGNISPLVCTDSTVYFWRVAVEEPDPNWKENSFQYITDKSGWGQDHFFQFKNNNFLGIDYDRINRQRNFLPVEKLIECEVIYSNASPAIYDNLYSLDGQMQDYGILNYTPKFHVAIIDKYTLEPWGTRFGGENPTNNFGNANDNFFRVMRYFTFHQNDANQMNAFVNLLENVVEDGNFILVYSPMTTLFNQLPANVITTFQNLGSDSVNTTRPNLPFAFFCKKGDPSTVVEQYAQLPGQNVHLEANIDSYDFLGQETSPIIGPSNQWGSLFWKQAASETPSQDTTVLNIRCLNNSGQLQLTIDTTFTSNDSIIELNNLVNSSLYPYIQLSAFYKDSFAYTPAQIDRWHVLYSPLPEAAIDGTSGYSWIPSMDTLSEGEDVSFAVDIKNIFTLPMDSLKVNYWIIDQNEVKHPITYPRQDSLLVGETMRDTVTFSTVGLSGINSFWMEVNPYTDVPTNRSKSISTIYFSSLFMLRRTMTNQY